MVEPRNMRVTDPEAKYLPDLLGLAPGERVVSVTTGRLTGDEVAESVRQREDFVRSFPGPAPTREGLLRHLKVYPADRQDVEEVAVMYGIELGVEVRQATVAAARTRHAAAKAGVSKNRRTTAQVVADVIALRDRGLVETAIADALNLTDRRVRQIIREGLGH